MGGFDTVGSPRFYLFGPRLRLVRWRRGLFLLLDSFSCSWFLPLALDATDVSSNGLRMDKPPTFDIYHISGGLILARLRPGLIRG